jgi:hypothetical protein
MINPVAAPASRIIANRHRLDELITDGPHAQVWRGFDLQMQREVVVKLLRSNQVESPEVFEANMRRVTSFKFPGLLPVQDFGTNEGTCYVVYDLIEGGSLRDYASRQILSTEQIIRWMIDLGETLEYAHSDGVIHQNIKPANILIDLDGQALISDFGLSPPAHHEEHPDYSFESLKYLAPEQLEEKPVDVRSDLYSLGIVMHELITGKLPYRSNEPRNLRLEILQGAHPDTANIPSELRHVLQKVIAHDPAHRYMSAEQFVNALRKVVAGASTRRWAMATAGVVIFIFGFGISSWWSGSKIVTDHAEKLIEPGWIERVKGLSAKDQLAEIAEKLTQLNPGFNGEVQETIENGVIVELIIASDNIKDLAPLRALSGLKSLTCFGTYSTESTGRLFDLTPLKGLPLTRLIIHDNERITDLSPLEGMPLTFLHCGRTSVSDLSPIKDCPLSVLVCRHTNVTDLSPLSGIKLNELYCDHTGVKDLSSLQGMPLVELHCENTSITDLSPLRGSPLKVIDCYRTLVSDLNPLRGMTELTSLNVLSTKVEDLSPLKDLPKIKLLWCDFDEKRDRDILRSLNSLEFINDNPVSVFWQQESGSHK